MRSYEIRSNGADAEYPWLIVCLQDGWKMRVPSLAKAWTWIEMLSEHEENDR